MDRLGLLGDPAARSALATELGRAIEWHPEIASTQARARELAGRGAGPGLVVADHQTSGHGRQGRAWVAPAGTSLLASWILRPLPADPALFALLSGVAIARALAALGTADARLKWPNDVQLGGKKVSGALADAAGDALVLGIGINVHQRDLGDLAASATSLALAGRPTDRLALLARLDRELARIAAGPEERQAALAEWRARASMLGREVEVRAAGGTPLRGVARELADDGALVLRTSSGDQRIFAGEVSLLT
jgi:BirA family transcriptional regulator, biotin operon repressor / biotin---[acetyl-CoA-carboxylase] ligase